MGSTEQAHPGRNRTDPHHRSPRVQRSERCGGGECAPTSRRRVGAQATSGASPPPGTPRTRVGDQGLAPVGELGACAVRGKVVSGDAPPPPPFVPRVGGGATVASGLSGGCTWPQVPTRPPPPPRPAGARGRTGRGPTLTHPRTESGPRTDGGGGGGAHARRRGASAKNNGERREATAHLRAGRQRRRVSQPGDGKGRDARTARCANWRASSWSPRPQVRPAVCGGDRGRTCAMAPCSTPPPLAKPGQGTSRISQFLESWQLRGSPGVGE